MPDVRFDAMPERANTLEEKSLSLYIYVADGPFGLFGGRSWTVNRDERVNMSTSDECIFCRIIKGEIPSTKIYEDDEYLVFRDIKPAAPTHVLVIPKRHVPRLSECGEKDRNLLSGLMLVAAKAAKLENLDSFRLIINDGAGSGQTVFHLHAHVLGGTNLGERLL